VIEPRLAGAGEPFGLTAFRDAGFAAVRSGESYLLVTAGHHSSVHKHPDDLSFCWYEAAAPVVVEAGKHSYDVERPEYKYARSPWAHNVVMVDDEPLWSPEVVGSGLRATGEGDGWYAILMDDLHAGTASARHQRLLVFAPGRLLLVFDHVQAERSDAEWTRVFHLAPSWCIDVIEGDRVRFREGERQLWLADCGSAACSITHERGGEIGKRGGWWFPRFGEAETLHTVHLRSRGGAQVLVTQFSCDRAEETEWDLGHWWWDGSVEVSLRVSGASIQVAAIGDEIRVS
jgi:hypothetical protein